MGSFLSSQPQLPPGTSSAAPAAIAATASPQWMLLAPYGGGNGEACNITGDPKTIAAAATSNGHRISVSLRRDPFSALSRICLRFLPGTGYDTWAASTVVAAHGGSVLVRIGSRESYRAPYAYDYFVYSNVGAAAAADPARPPSLYKIPSRWWLDISATGLLCHGEAEFVVAELTIVGSKDDAAKRASSIAFELRLFRHGEWCVKQQPRIIHGSGMYGKQRLWARWETIATVPLGNGMLCWVDRYSGVIIFSDVLDVEGPSTLRYVPYPAESVMHPRKPFVCADGALKLVSMSPHRCPHCGCSEHVTDIVIWTLKTDAMAWVLETGTNNSAELWMLPDAPDYARVHLVYRVATMNGVAGDGDHDVASMNNGIGDAVSDEGGGDAFSTLSTTASLHGGLQGGNGSTSASMRDQQQGNNEPATVGSNEPATVAAGGPSGAGEPIRWSPALSGSRSSWRK